ncbi:MAG: prepilin-type N-terminal cleavage/methylation domain-containing protein [Candidatus Omnitrophica bacterium]|nr:prepilin-type N-terminal cleavage/methylation domain-containing protein [Candidatus Omnitrophota bacterium]
MRTLRRNHPGFTLIELLIVIAIILILIAIALPNFLEAQVRAKVTKAKGEIRTLAIAYEAYRTDFKYYPRACITEHPVGCSDDWGFVGSMKTNYPAVVAGLTTPIAYMKEVLVDLFAVDYSVQGLMQHVPESHPYARYRSTRKVVWNIQNPVEQPPDPVPADKITPHWHTYTNMNPSFYRSKEYILVSMGPDHDEDALPQYAFGAGYVVGSELYTPTNGTTSSGDLVYAGP